MVTTMDRHGNITISGRSKPPTLSENQRAEHWIPKVRKPYDKSRQCAGEAVRWAVETGKALIAAKEKCGHGQFGRLFAGHEDAVDGAVAFSHSWGAKLMCLASHSGIANLNHGSTLPADVHALYELAKVPPALLEQAIEDGKVTSDMTRKEARAFRVSLTAPEEETENDDEEAENSELGPTSLLLKQFAVWRDWLNSFLEKHPKQRLRAKSVMKTLYLSIDGEE